MKAALFRTALRSLAKFALPLLLPIPAAAQSEYFSDMASFAARVNIFSVSRFEGISSGVLSTIPGGYPGMTYFDEATFGRVLARRTGGNSNKPGFTLVSYWRVHQPSFDFYSQGAAFGNALVPGLGAYGNDDGIIFELRNQFGLPITAVGAHFGSIQEPSECCVQQWAIVRFQDGGSETINLNAKRGGERGTRSFFGFASPGRPIRSIEFNQLGHTPLLDNFTYGFAEAGRSVKTWAPGVVRSPKGTGLSDRLFTAPPDPSTSIGAVSGLAGQGTIKRSNGASEPLTVGTPVYYGDIVETDPNSVARLTFADDTALDLSANSQIKIDSYVYDNSPSPNTGTPLLRRVLQWTSDKIEQARPVDAQEIRSGGSMIRGAAEAIISRELLANPDSTLYGNVGIWVENASPVGVSTMVPIRGGSLDAELSFIFLGDQEGELSVLLGDTLVATRPLVPEQKGRLQHISLGLQNWTQAAVKLTLHVDGPKGNSLTFTLSSRDRSMSSFENWFKEGDGSSEFVLLTTSDQLRTLFKMGEALALDLSRLRDLNGDGRSDLIFQNTTTGQRVVWFMNGTTFAGTADFGTLDPAWQFVDTGDFNGDGKPDMVLQNTVTGDRYVWFLDGTRNTGGTSIANVPPVWKIAVVGDFNNDGKPDLVFQNTSTGQRVVWFMNGASYAGTADLGTLEPAWEFAGTGDFNADGKPDMVLQNTINGDRYVWFLDGTRITGGQAIGNAPVAWRIAGTGDYNGDGRPDIVLQNTVTGDRVVWFMNGASYAGGAYLGNVPPEWSLVP